MDEGYRLRWQHVILADVVAIAICMALIYEYIGFGGTGIMPTIVCPLMCVISSIGVVMWANGSGSSYTNGPKWDTMNEEQKTYASSILGLHLAIGMAIIACAVPLIMAGVWGIVGFILLQLAGFACVFVGVFRVISGSRIGDRKLVPKGPTLVWGVFIMLLFTIVAVPILITESASGTTDINVTVGENAVSVDAPMAKFSIKYSDIGDIYVDDDFSRGSRTSGYHDTRVSCGTYRNSLGTYKLASYDACAPCIVIKTVSGYYYAFNQPTGSETQALYESIQAKIS